MTVSEMHSAPGFDGVDGEFVKDAAPLRFSQRRIIRIDQAR